MERASRISQPRLSSNLQIAILFFSCSLLFHDRNRTCCSIESSRSPTRAYIHHTRFSKQRTTTRAQEFNRGLKKVIDAGNDPVLLCVCFPSDLQKRPV